MKGTVNWVLSNVLRIVTPGQSGTVHVTLRRTLQGRTFALPHFDGEQLSSTFVDDDFTQDTQWVNKEGVFQLPGCVKPPLSWTWNI